MSDTNTCISCSKTNICCPDIEESCFSIDWACESFLDLARTIYKNNLLAGINLEQIEILDDNNENIIEIEKRLIKILKENDFLEILKVFIGNAVSKDNSVLLFDFIDKEPFIYTSKNAYSIKKVANKIVKFKIQAYNYCLDETNILNTREYEIGKTNNLLSEYEVIKNNNQLSFNVINSDEKDLYNILLEKNNLLIKRTEEYDIKLPIPAIIFSFNDEDSLSIKQHASNYGSLANGILNTLKDDILGSRTKIIINEMTMRQQNSQNRSKNLRTKWFEDFVVSLPSANPLSPAPFSVFSNINQFTTTWKQYMDLKEEFKKSILISTNNSSKGTAQQNNTESSLISQPYIDNFENKLDMLNEKLSKFFQKLLEWDKFYNKDLYANKNIKLISPNIKGSKLFQILKGDINPNEQ